MKYETVRGLRVPKLGFGTWNIGGAYSPDRSQDRRGVEALRSALELGYTHFDTAELYAAGHTEELLGRAIRDVGQSRESLFIASKVKPDHLRYEDVLRACEASLTRLQTEYLDLYVIHWPGLLVRLSEAFRALNKLVADSKVRHLGVSNFDLGLLKTSQALSETPLLTDQVPFSLSNRAYVRNGVLTHCQGNDILLTAYSPLGQGHFKPGRSLSTIAEAHSAAPQQIALAWLVQQPRVITIPMSLNPEHQRQNLDAADIILTDAELAQLA